MKAGSWFSPVATAAMRASVASASVENSNPDMRPSPPLAPISKATVKALIRIAPQAAPAIELRADHEAEAVGGMGGVDGGRADQPAGAHDGEAAEPFGDDARRKHRDVEADPEHRHQPGEISRLGEAQEQAAALEREMDLDSRAPARSSPARRRRRAA